MQGMPLHRVSGRASGQRTAPDELVQGELKLLGEHACAQA